MRDPRNEREAHTVFVQPYTERSFEIIEDDRGFYLRPMPPTPSVIPCSLIGRILLALRLAWRAFF